MISWAKWKRFDILTDFTQKARVMKMKYYEGIHSIPAGENETYGKKSWVYCS